MSLDNFKKALSESIYGKTPEDCCVRCKQPFSDSNTRTQAGWRETKITKLCEDCWDGIFAGGEE